MVTENKIMNPAENKNSVNSETKKTILPKMEDWELFDVADLLEAFFEFIDKVPAGNWNNLEELMKTVPHFHRYLRFEALCRAFGIQSIDGFMTGDFIYESLQNKFNLSVIATRYIKLLFTVTELSELIKGINSNRLVKDLNLLNLLSNSLTVYKTELSEIIDPDKIRVFRKELIEKYNFPKESIFEIDLKYAIF